VAAIDPSRGVRRPEFIAIYRNEYADLERSGPRGREQRQQLVFRRADAGNESGRDGWGALLTTFHESATQNDPGHTLAAFHWTFLCVGLSPAPRPGSSDNCHRRPARGSHGERPRSEPWLLKPERQNRSGRVAQLVAFAMLEVTMQRRAPVFGGDQLVIGIEKEQFSADHVECMHHAPNPAVSRRVARRSGFEYDAARASNPVMLLIFPRPCKV